MVSVDFSPNVVGAPQSALAGVVVMLVLWAVMYSFAGITTSSNARKLLQNIAIERRVDALSFPQIAFFASLHSRSMLEIQIYALLKDCFCVQHNYRSPIPMAFLFTEYHRYCTSWEMIFFFFKKSHFLSHIIGKQDIFSFKIEKLKISIFLNLICNRAVVSYKLDKFQK